MKRREKERERDILRGKCESYRKEYGRVFTSDRIMELAKASLKADKAKEKL